VSSGFNIFQAELLGGNESMCHKVMVAMCHAMVKTCGSIRQGSCLRCQLRTWIGPFGAM
jgi:hypothetical protein